MNSYQKRMAKYKEADLKRAEAKKLKEQAKAKTLETLSSPSDPVDTSPLVEAHDNGAQLGVANESTWASKHPTVPMTTVSDVPDLSNLESTALVPDYKYLLDTNNIVIGLMGKKGSGKDTVAELLINEYGFNGKITATNILKKICSTCLGLDKSIFEEKKDTPFHRPFKFSFSHARAIIDTVDQILSSEFKNANGLNKIRSTGTQNYAPRVFKTPREILQFVGTELIQSLYKDFFPKTMYSQFSEKQGGYVITDMRFTHEAGYAHEVFQFFYPVKIVGRELPHDGTESHKSENDWESIVPFFELDNTNMDTLNTGLKILLRNIVNHISKNNNEIRHAVVQENVISPKAYEYLGLSNLNESFTSSKAKFGHPNENFVVRGWENEE